MKTIGMRFVVVLLAVCLIAGIVGCSAPAAQTSDSSQTSSTGVKTLKYGLATALTGPAANWGQEMKRGHELVFEQINKAGGLKVGNDTYNIELITYDHKYNGPEGAAVAQRLIFQDQVKFMTLHLTVASLPALPITTENKIFTVNSIYAATGIGPNYPYNFRCQYTALEAAEGVYGYITTNLKDVKNVAVISNDDDSGKANVGMATKVATSMGLSVVDTKLVPRGTTDFYPTLGSMLPKNPDAIDTGSLPPADMALFVKQAREKGFKGTIFEVANIGDIPGVIKVAGKESAEGILSIGLDFGSDVVTAEQKQWKVDYLAKYGEPFSSQSGEYMVLPATFVAAVKASGTLDCEKTSSVLQDLTYNILGEKNSFGGQERYGIKRQIIQPIYVSVIKNGALSGVGKYVPVIP